MMSKYTKIISGVQTEQIKPFSEVHIAYSMICQRGTGDDKGYDNPILHCTIMQ